MKRIAVGILAHVDAGKTTLSELADRATQMGTCNTPDSGKQEYLEGVVNRVLFS